MKKMGTRNLLLAMMAILAMGGFIFGCTDSQTKNETLPDTNPSLPLQGSIQGLVVDVNNNVVVNAKATLASPGRTTEVTTNSAGQFLFENVPVSGQLAVNQDYYEYDYGSGNPYLITVQAEGYETSFTAAMLDYASLESTGQIDSIGGELQAIGDLQVTAITTVMRKPIGVVSGYVNNYESALPIADALVSLSRSGVPDPWDIWYNGYSDWSITANTGLTDANGLWTIATVPEGTDASSVCYTITIGASGFGTLSGNSVCVGSVPHTYWADYNSSDLNPATAFPLRPAQPQKDTINPYVTATNLPVAKIALPNLSGPFTFTFNEAMRTELTEVIINVQGGAPTIVALSWDTATDPNHPVLTVTPETSLPEGFTVNFELKNFFDVNGKPYQGKDPQNNADAFQSVGTSLTNTKIALLTAGDPTLMQASGVAQDAAVANPLQPIGGKSGNVPQANNLNLLFTLDGVSGSTIGDETNEANTVFLSWDAAVPLEGTGVARQYKVYTEFATGGFASGVPVFVAQTQQRLDGNPDTSIAVTLLTVQGAIVIYNNNNPAGDPDLPLVTGENGTATSNYFDDGFTLNMAVTTVNSDSREGPYSNVASIQDVVPPTVANQGLGFVTTGLTPTNWARKLISVTPQAVLLLGVDYTAADFVTFAALPYSLQILMSEDLQAVQTVGATPVFTGGETLGTCSVTNPEFVGPSSLPAVTCVVNDVLLVEQNDHIALSVTDEAGKVSEAGDSVVHLFDRIPPFVATGTLIDNASDPDQIVLTMSEPVEQVSAETIANYIGIIAGVDSVALEADGVTVTVTATADFLFGLLHHPGFDGDGLDVPATNLVTIKGAAPGTTGVEDLVGNVQPLIDLSDPPNGTDDVPFAFQLVDEIAPRILPTPGSVQTSGGGALNANAFADSDNRLDVGDTVDSYALVVPFTEPVVWDVDGSGVLDAADADLLGLDLATTPPGRFSGAVNLSPVNVNTPRWGIAILLGPVAPLDSFTVTAADLAGNAVNSSYDTITLGAALGLYVIN